MESPQSASSRGREPAVSRRSGLDAVFAPRGVAVIGASDREGSVGRTLLRNMIERPFGGTVYPVNPAHEQVLGIKAYPSIAEVPGVVDLAVIATPAASVPGVVRGCADRGVRAAVIISAGFREIGPAGLELEQRIRSEARRGKMRIVGPNCVGVIDPVRGLNATFAGTSALPGRVAFVSQSGALCTAILDWSLEANVGFSKFVSIGTMLDVGWGDIISYLGDDPQTDSILLAMESVGDAASFLSAARAVALAKPIIVIKSGRTGEAAKAAASHTGALTGSDDVLDAAFRRCGVLRVERIDELFMMADILSKQPAPAGRRLAIVSNAGGPGILATDALISGGGELATLSAQTLAALDAMLPKHWSHGNPVDLLGDADAERYAKAIDLAANDPGADGLLVIFAPQGMTEASAVARRLEPFAHLAGKPVLASWMGGLTTEQGVSILKHAGIPHFAYADTAARMFNYLWKRRQAIRALYETPEPLHPHDVGRRVQADAVLAAARAQGRVLLTEIESKQILEAYGIPVTQTLLAANADDAVAAAERLNYPVVIKLNSTRVTHKARAGGVRLNVATAESVRIAYREIAEQTGEAFEGVSVQPMVTSRGYEVMLGSSVDAQFGPAIAFALGGSLVEVVADRAIALPPLTTTLARRMMERTRIYQAMVRENGAETFDFAQLEELVVRFAQLVVDRPRIKEIDVNPLLVSGGGALALDARIVLHDHAIADEDLPRPVIRAFPERYVWTWPLQNGERLRIRPIRPEDEPAMRAFQRTLSETSVYLRYGGIQTLDERVAHEQLSRMCFIDYDREMTLVAERTNPAAGESTVVGVGTLVRLRDEDGAEFAVLVSDGYQHRGLGSELLSRLTEIAREERWGAVIGYIMQENLVMQDVCRRLGFSVRFVPAEGLMVARLDAR
ncbi:GNAT family N-acetyltransferase [bacterium]|nr:MAG: GNAT family N-acetyltransferase [bacterium]